MPRKRHRIHANPFSIRGDVDPVDVQNVFESHAPLALDIGCGQGWFALELAKAHPEWNVLGIEIREHLVKQVQQLAKEHALNNLWAVFANANTHLSGLIPDRSVLFVSLNFPDPWFKKRHHKRRVLTSAWLGVLCNKMIPGAEIHVTTDYAPLAKDMLQVLSNTPDFANLHASHFAKNSTTGILSKRERTHLERGNQVYRLHFRYVANQK